MGFAVIIGMSSPSMALNIGIGATGWYADWRFESSEGNTNFDAAPLYGPVISLGFSREWSLSGVFLYGKFDQSDKGNGPGKITRYDSDTTLNYSIARYVSLFLGFKYMGYDFSEGEHAGYGPGLGLSFTAPLADNLFLLGNVSGLYIWGHHDDQGGDYDYTEPGANGGVSLAYNISSTVIALGVRAQRFVTRPQESSGSARLTHTFYGVTLSAVYSFTL